MPKKFNAINPGSRGVKPGVIVSVETSEEKKAREAQEALQRQEEEEEKAKWQGVEEVAGKIFFNITWDHCKVNNKRGYQYAARIYLDGKRCLVIPNAEQEGGMRDVRVGMTSSCKLTSEINLTLGNSAFRHMKIKVYLADVVITDINQFVLSRKETREEHMCPVVGEIQQPQEFKIAIIKNKTYLITSDRLVAKEVKRKIDETESGWFINSEPNELLIPRILDEFEIMHITTLVTELVLKIEL